MVRSTLRPAFALLFLASAAAAQVPAGPEFRVNTNTAGSQVRPNAAVEPDGDFVVVWTGPDGQGVGVFGQRYDVAGAPRDDNGWLSDRA